MKKILTALLPLLLCACGVKEYDAVPVPRQAPIAPDYREVTMPVNMAAPTFALTDTLVSEPLAVFVSGDKKVVVEGNGEKGMCINNDDWHDLIAAGNGTITVTVQAKMRDTATPVGDERSAEAIEYKPFNIYISRDSIDNYVTYRLIEPGYEVWNKMGIYQRDMTNYDERALLTNDDTEGGCMNCHSFCNHDGSMMSLHLRQACAGTYIMKNGTTQHLTPTPSLVYPSWHDGGRYIAYSQNQTKQMFHTTDCNRIEVFDYKSDVVVLDTETGNTLTCPQLSSADAFETFPSWHGNTLYFCTADSVEIPKDYDRAHYSLCSISFDPAKGTFGTQVDTLYNARKMGGSVSLPRVSPDGRWLLFSRSAYGQFHVWHKDAQMQMIDLRTRQMVTPPMKGMRCFGGSWSKNGRWVVFMSRNDDGLYTRLLIARCNDDGTFTKPFVLPQSDASHDLRLMKSYNLPEMTVNKSKIVTGNLLGRH